VLEDAGERAVLVLWADSNVWMYQLLAILFSMHCSNMKIKKIKISRIKVKD
jgi:hypothetical protein